MSLGTSTSRHGSDNTTGSLLIYVGKLLKGPGPVCSLEALHEIPQTHYTKLSHSIPAINGPMSRPIGDMSDNSERGTEDASNAVLGPGRSM